VLWHNKSIKYVETIVR